MILAPTLSRSASPPTARAVAAVAPDLAAYGRIKAPAWLLLMRCADSWANQIGCDVRDPGQAANRTP